MNDPIFAAIEAHRVAAIALEDAPDKLFERASVQEVAALDALLLTKPATIAGAVAAIDYLLASDRANTDTLYATDLVVFLETLADGLRGL